MISRNPVAFRPWQVSCWTTLVYFALLGVLVYIHETVPASPSAPDVYRGMNLTQAWVDLQEITRYYHPYNSRDNDRVRRYMLARIQQILENNACDWRLENMGGLGTPGAMYARYR
jgi:hypothetical protein